MTYARCSTDQVRLLVDALFSEKSSEWKSNQFIKEGDVRELTHILLFNQAEKIPGGQRSERNKEQVTLLFEKINELSSLKNSENISDFYKEMNLLRRIFITKKRDQIVIS